DRRDPDKGKLTLRDNKLSTDNGVSGMDFPIGVQFSPDGRFVYVLDSQGALTAFRITGKGEKSRLEFVEANQHADLKGVRGLDIHPDGTTLFASCCPATTLPALTPATTTRTT